MKQLERLIMRAIKLTLLLALTIMMVACGKDDSKSSSNNNYENFINSNDGVEFKAPSKVNMGQNAYNSNSQISEILLTIDNDGTFHLRSSIPSNLNSNQEELAGHKGEWKVTSRGLIELYKNGNKIATSNEYYQTSGSTSSSLSLNFTSPISLDVINTANGQIYNNGQNMISFNTTQLNLQGFITVIR
jgi:hypothetical protein